MTVTDDIVLSPATLHSLARRALLEAGATAATADATAHALVYADARGLSSHGVARLPMYLAQLRNGRVDAAAVPAIVRDKGAAFLVDAADGLAFDACALAISTGIERARTFGTAAASVTRSHHFGAGAYHLEAVGKAGLVGLAFSNAPGSMPVWGGKHPLLGTNPIAAVFPRAKAEPLMIDLSLSHVVRDGKPIPEGWATTIDGEPTTDARAALDGMMLPFGGAKGAVLALMVELLAAALSGAQFGSEAGSFLTEDGPRSRVGHLFWLLDPDALAGSRVYQQRIETLIELMLVDDDVRLPGYRRHEIAAASASAGIALNRKLFEQLKTLANDRADAL
ncbi:Ureidoglycolate dehydrogenase [Candidatus Burkholderia verschuerenii]|uniref:Ureidoglycolate dehydrogenase n=1 Tax=Candidatus Burkholderia verschuerenii TaxID=242163 RepID=A0A0L0MIJ3_9BURK|nr:Ldh family oxidoreductase [Candidatus Burkholderia verschuerenii]KND62118.1 Ureidoglycolate dehydrogenase [Candidatus Burkholderia verschuerenii]